VKSLWRLARRTHGDVIGQCGIQRIGNPIRGRPAVHDDARDLTGGVDARVGTSCNRKAVPPWKHGGECVTHD
jgi:hypothetical protein